MAKLTIGMFWLNPTSYLALDRFNVKFLREVLEVIKTPNVSVETNAANTPGMIRPVGDEHFIHVIMPMHLG